MRKFPAHTLERLVVASLIREFTETLIQDTLMNMNSKTDAWNGIQKPTPGFLRARVASGTPANPERKLP
jgi:hypothetical protein